MADSLKLHAPKPVKNFSNIQGVKLICNFEKIAINELPSQTYTPKTKINNILSSSIKNINKLSFQMLQRKKQMLSNAHTPKYKSSKLDFDDIMINDIKDDFKSINVEKSDLYFKSEILSILNKNDSTSYESFCQEISFDEDSYIYFEDIRTSNPPERSKNPFYKNLKEFESNLNLNYDLNEDM